MLRIFILRLCGRAEPPAGRPGNAGPVLPAAANENLPIVKPGMDPVATLARVRLVLTWLRQENARQGTLLARPEWRRYYEEGRALERALVWKYFERR